MTDEELTNDKTVDPHWEIPADKTDVRFILYHNQVWINRRSLLLFLDRAIEVIKFNHIPGINNYWDYTKIQYLTWMREQFEKLDPNEAEELEHE